MRGNARRQQTVGEIIRNLRKRKHWTQDNLALAMTEHYQSPDRTDISKVENGASPRSAAWLEAALTALGATYREYQAAMETAAYPPRLILPNENEIRQIRVEVADILNRTPYPTYLGDCAIRILDWNEAYERLWPQHTKEHAVMLRQHSTSMPLMMFGSKEYGHGGFADLIANPEAFYPQQIRLLYHDWQQARDEPWCKAILTSLLKHVTFRQHWEATEQSVTSSTRDAHWAEHVLRLRTPIRLRQPPRKPEEPPVILSFQVLIDRFAEDHRFRLVTLYPSDTFTIEQCLRQAREGG